jgi:xylan 1,4-beta-xylosidase
LQHCDQNGLPLDFISYHAKGSPKVQDGRVLMGSAKQLRDVEAGYKIVNAFPKFAQLPIILSESDPEGCAACSARVYPQNAYRNGAVYAVYTAVTMKGILDLAEQSKTNIEGMLTWAFEFENQPYFDGFRTLATNGIDKPVLNFFRMAGQMSGDRLPVAGTSNVNGIASHGPHDVAVLAWNYADDVTDVKAQAVRIRITGIQNGRATLHSFAIDETHSNAWTAWKSMGSPQAPTKEQYAALEKAGQLQEFAPPETVRIRNGAFEKTLQLAGESLTLLHLTWQ